MKVRNESFFREMGNAEIRQIEGEERTIELSFSSEEPYTRYFGLEILDHSGNCVDLTRLKTVGCVLFNHNRDYVVGKILDAWIDGDKGRAKIRFDDDADADTIFKKVQSGTLSGVSVGYKVNAWEEVAVGKKSSDERFTGPCSIARSWSPYEISIVSVPADSTVGVGRSMESDPDHENRRSLDLFIRQLQINKANNKEEK